MYDLLSLKINSDGVKNYNNKLIISKKKIEAKPKNKRSHNCYSILTRVIVSKDSSNSFRQVPNTKNGSGIFLF